uniref:Non-specific lipid-transfer protein n=1 Tax=Manihot esculenta TaxID=3983 RepID=A0A2C9VTJ9_MANES
MKGLVILALVVVALVEAMPGEAVDCRLVDASLAFCIPFLARGDGFPSPTCCLGVRNLQVLTLTTADRRAACECIKAVGARIPFINEDAASSLPQKCGVDLNIPISRTADCQSIN